MIGRALFSNYEHISFNERASPGSRLVSSCCSPGGNLVVIGDTHRFLRIFRLSEEGVLKLKDIEAHSVRITFLFKFMHLVKAAKCFFICVCISLIVSMKKNINFPSISNLLNGLMRSVAVIYHFYLGSC